MFHGKFHVPRHVPLGINEIQVCDNRWRAEPLMVSNLVAMTTPLVNKLTTFKELLSRLCGSEKVGSELVRKWRSWTRSSVDGVGRYQGHCILLP